MGMHLLEQQKVTFQRWLQHCFSCVLVLFLATALCIPQSLPGLLTPLRNIQFSQEFHLTYYSLLVLLWLRTHCVLMTLFHFLSFSAKVFNIPADAAHAIAQMCSFLPSKLSHHFKVLATKSSCFYSFMIKDKNELN